jgi:hypothetical protein
MKAGKFFLYYSIVLQIILCMYLSNPKLEWPLLIGSFYVMLIFMYGLILEIKDITTNPFMDEFKSSRAIREIGQIITSTTGLDANDYLKYLMLVPVIITAISIKLITNYDGNRKIRQSKSETKHLDATKVMICISVLLLFILTIFGFPLESTPDFIKTATWVPLFTIPALVIVSIVELIMSVYIYKSY